MAHRGANHDFGRGHLIETALLEQAQRVAGQRVAGEPLLAFAQPLMHRCIGHESAW
jgi:hypothetical protein